MAGGQLDDRRLLTPTSKRQDAALVPRCNRRLADELRRRVVEYGEVSESAIQFMEANRR
jgi:NAD-dependent SIR2 family protein deacetylase